ncbi:unnamed protein product [Agarophyton chilense]
MNSSHKSPAPSPAPRRVALTTIVKTPLITPRRLKIPPQVSNRQRVHSAPRRLVSSRVNGINALDVVEQSPKQLKPCFELVDHCQSEDVVDRAKLSPFDQISRTPARTENDRWLKQFGIDISLLRIYDSDEDDAQQQAKDENQHPNLTPSRPTQPREKVIKPEPVEVPLSFPTPPSISSHLPAQLSPMNDENPAKNQPITPRRLQSARSRRQSLKISQREIISLIEEVESADVCLQRQQQPVQRTQPTPIALSSNKDIVGSNVFLTPVRASRKQRLELGADTVVTPVRRSLRLSKRNDKLAPIDQPEARARMLQQFGFTYTPNHSLQ